MLDSLKIDPQWIITDDTPIEAPAIGGMGHGFVERDVTAFPMHSASPSFIKEYSMDDWPEMLEEQERKQSSLVHLRNTSGPNGGPIPFLDQGRYGYCWAHSAVHAVMMQRAKQNLPYVALSAYSVAAVIMNGADRGGWAGLAFDWITNNGVAPQTRFPQGQANPRLWTTETKIEAAKFKISEGYWDAGKHPGLRNFSMGQLFALLYDCIPAPVEFSWWTHSVLGMRFVDKKDRSDKRDINRYALDILNSHAGYGVNGLGRLEGSRMIPDSSVALTVAHAA